MRLVGTDIQTDRTRIIMTMVEVHGYLDGLFMSSNTRQVPRVL
jgi:hypothetical protein